MPGMQISMWVPYDERELRATIRFIIRKQVRALRVVGGFIAVLGVGVVALDPTDVIAYTMVALGLLFAFAIAPISVSRSVRLTPPLARHGWYITLDDEWITTINPLAEARYRWAAFEVVETPEAWYGQFSKIQAMAIPKRLMTEGQRAEFAAFLAGTRVGAVRSPHAGSDL
jgi:hypothetical protein